MRLLVVLVLAGALGAMGLTWLAWHDLNTPVGGTATAVVTVKRGTTLRPVLDELQQRGVLASPTILYAFARLKHTTSIRTGQYEVHADQNPRTVLTMFVEGRVMLEAFTVPEGLNRWQVRDLLVSAQWMTSEQFESLCDDKKLLANHQIPGPSCEGYLFPETYKFARGVPPAQILQTMFAAYKRELAAATAGGVGPMGLGERQFVTLASIVEKETGSPVERPHIACVFYNRLRAKPAWRLETDPTVIYAATLADPHFNGNLTRAHLRTLENPYNTYKVYGLPPGPIASPGRAALDAVAKPSACADYFFVSSNNGQHIFCPTLDCHNKAVQKWQVEYFRHKH